MIFYIKKTPEGIIQPRAQNVRGRRLGVGHAPVDPAGRRRSEANAVSMSVFLLTDGAANPTGKTGIIPLIPSTIKEISIKD